MTQISTHGLPWQLHALMASTRTAGIGAVIRILFGIFCIVLILSGPLPYFSSKLVRYSVNCCLVTPFQCTTLAGNDHNQETGHINVIGALVSAIGALVSAIGALVSAIGALSIVAQGSQLTAMDGVVLPGSLVATRTGANCAGCWRGTTSALAAACSASCHHDHLGLQIYANHIRDANNTVGSCENNESNERWMSPAGGAVFRPSEILPRILSPPAPW